MPAPPRIHRDNSDQYSVDDQAFKPGYQVKDSTLATVAVHCAENEPPGFRLVDRRFTFSYSLSTTRVLEGAENTGITD